MTASDITHRVDFHYSPLKLIIMALVTAVLTVGPLIGAIAPDAPLGVRLVLLGAALFFGVWLAALLKRLGEREVILSIGLEGIYDKRVGSKLIPWADLEQVYMFRARSQMYLGAVLIQPEDYINPPTSFDKFAQWTSNASGLPKVSISLMGLNASSTRIAEVVRDVVPHQIVSEPRKIGIFGA